MNVPAIELANTAEDRRDLLGSPSELAGWLRAMEPMIGLMPPEVSLRVPDVRALRGAVRSLFEAVVSGRPLPEEAVAAVNAASADVPIHRALDVSDPASPRVVDRASGGSHTAELLATIARSAVEVVGSDGRDRLRRCAAPGCGRFFLTTRAGRRWCRDACGTRVRVARHHASRRV